MMILYAKDVKDKIMIDLYNNDWYDILDNISFDIIITDPPYLYEKGGNSKLFECNALERTKRTMKNSEFGKEEIYSFLNNTKIKMDKPQWFVFCSEKQLPFYLNWCTENKFLFNLLVWEKQLSILNRNRFSTNLEYIVRIYNWGVPLNNLPNEKNYYYGKAKHYNSVRGKNKLHPQQKPVELVNELIEISTQENQTVFDPFMGSGSVGESCLIHNRNYIGCEKVLEIYSNAYDRLYSIKNKMDV